MGLFLTGILIYLLAGLAAAFAPERLRGRVSTLCALPAAALVLCPALTVLFSENRIMDFVELSYPAGQLILMIDSLSALFICIIAPLSILCGLYGEAYLRPYLGKGLPTGAHYFFLNLMVASMLMVTVVQNGLVFLVMWEVMSLSSFFLVSFENGKKEVFDAALKYFVMMHVSVLLLMVCFGLLYAGKDSFSFEVFKELLADKPGLRDAVFVLAFLGFGLKAGFIPLHSWLPAAHPAAPSHVSGLMSGVMIKLGLYGIMRMIVLGGAPSPWILYMMLGISALTALLGILYATAQSDLKRMLAFSSVENIGIMGMGISLGLLGIKFNVPALAALGFSGALLHMLNHSLFKTLLFYGAGAVYNAVHTRNMEQMGGLLKKMPCAGAFFLTGALAISGLPPFNGFISELLIYLGMLQGLRSGDTLLAALCFFSMAALALTGMLALLCFTKAFSVVFLGSPRTEQAGHAKESPALMLAPMSILAISCLAIGLLPFAAFKALRGPVELLTGGLSKEFPHFDFLNTMNTLGYVSALFCLVIIIAVLLFLTLKYLAKKRGVTSAPTWGCGYDAPTPKMQYTGSSYAEMLLGLAKPLMRLRRDTQAPSGPFPRHASFRESFADVFDAFAITPASRLLIRFLGLFSWIQSGKMQLYIFYSLIFLIIAIIWILST